jgi:hypothetical protein
MILFILSIQLHAWLIRNGHALDNETRDRMGEIADIRGQLGLIEAVIEFLILRNFL